MVYFLVFFIVGAIIALFSVEFARKESVRGRLRIDGAEARVVPITSGTVSRIAVTEGMTISKGDVIAEITSDQYIYDQVTFGAATIEQLENEIGKLEILLETRIHNFDQEFKNAQRREKELRLQLGNIEVQLFEAKELIKMTKIWMMDGIKFGLDLQQPIDTQNQLRLTMLKIESQISSAIEAQRAAVRNQELQIAEINSRIATIRTQIEQTKHSRRHLLLSPIDGKVTAIQAREGEHVTTSIPIALVIPENAKLIAVVYVPSRAIGLIVPGLRVKLRYDAFPYQEFGSSDGVVYTVSYAALEPSEIGMVTRAQEIQLNEVYYQVKIELDEQTVLVRKKEVDLRAGMELTTIIILEDRKLIEWILRPFLNR